MSRPFLGLDDLEMINIDDQFYISKYPITNLQYADFVYRMLRTMKTPYHWPPPSEWWGYYESNTWPNNIEASHGLASKCDPSHPVTFVSWLGAVCFCTWLSEIKGVKFRLPTVQEWVLAATGGENRRYPWGNEWRKNHCNTRETGIIATTPVGQYSPHGDSPFGCSDMVGNVFEWTSTPWENEDGYYTVCGSAWFSERRHTGCQAKHLELFDTIDCGVGFRVVAENIVLSLERD